MAKKLKKSKVTYLGFKNSIDPKMSKKETDALWGKFQKLSGNFHDESEKLEHFLKTKLPSKYS